MGGFSSVIQRQSLTDCNLLLLGLKPYNYFSAPKPGTWNPPHCLSTWSSLCRTTETARKQQSCDRSYKWGHHSHVTVTVKEGRTLFNFCEIKNTLQLFLSYWKCTVRINERAVETDNFVVLSVIWSIIWWKSHFNLELHETQIKETQAIK